MKWKKCWRASSCSPLLQPLLDSEAPDGEGASEGLLSVYRGPEATRGHQSHDSVQRPGRNDTQHGGDGLASRLEAERGPPVMENLH